MVSIMTLFAKNDIVYEEHTGSSEMSVLPHLMEQWTMQKATRKMSGPLFHEL